MEANGHDTAAEAPAPAIGGNVSDETLRQFEREYVALKVKVDEARGALGALCKTAEGNGIDVKTFKQVLKVKQMLPSEAEAKIHTFTRYTHQLGIFGLIEEFRQAEATADNAASVDAAERDAKKRKRGGRMSKDAAAALDKLAEPKSGGAEEAAYAQGYEAGEAGSDDANPYRPEHPGYAHWARGHAAGDRNARAQS